MACSGEVGKTGMIQRERRVDHGFLRAHLASPGSGSSPSIAPRGGCSDHCWRQAQWLLLALVSRPSSPGDYRDGAPQSIALRLNLGLLAAVLLTGSSAMGPTLDRPARRVQAPALRIAKLVVIITLSTYCTNTGTRCAILGPRKSFLFILPPMALIMKQPDLGTSLVLIAVWFGILGWRARAPHLAIVALSGVVAFGALWHVAHQGLPEATPDLVPGPSADPRGSGAYHPIEIAIGSGLTGRACCVARRQGGFIPEQHTDFINTVIGEELGFIGSSVLLLLFFCLIYRGLRVAWNCDDPNGRLIAVGIVAMFTFHVFVNIGMTVHIMPVTGVPLPFLSYGGSSMILNLACVAVLVNIERHREDLRF